MNLETKITIYKFTPQVFTLTPAHSSNKKGATFCCNSLILISRGSGIRTHDPLLPKQVR